MATQPPQPPVSVTRAGPFVLIDPVTDRLAPLVVRRLQPVATVGTELGLPLHALYGFGCGLTNRPRLVVWAGLESVVLGRLKTAGVSFAVRDAAGMPTADPVAPAGTADPSVVSSLAGVRRVLVRYEPAAVDALGLVVQVCATHPGARTVVVVRRREEGERLLRRMAAAGIMAVMVDGRHPGEAGRVTVCTLGTSGRGGIDRADLVLVVDALHGTWADPLTDELIPHDVWEREDRPADEPDPRRPRAVGLMERLAGVRPAAKVMGFLSRGRTLSPFEQVRAWQVYGPDEVVVPRHGAVERKVVTTTEPITLMPDITAGADDLAVKKAVWADPIRARRLARLARLLRAGDRAVVEREFPRTAAGQAYCIGYSNGVPQTNITPSSNFTPKTVLVLVEGVDQAKAFGRVLPGWPVVTGLDGDDPIQTPNAGVIATALGVERIAGGVFDVVVRAAPGRGLPPLPHGWLETDEPTPRPLLLVDVEDSGHPLPALWSRMRRRAYLRAGWARGGADLDVAAWERFRALVIDRGERP